MFTLKRMAMFLLVMAVIGIFSSCSEDKKETETTEKKAPQYQPPAGGLTRDGVELNGLEAKFTQKMMLQLFPGISITPSSIIHAACGETDSSDNHSGNGWMNNKNRDQWDLYKFQFNPSTQIWTLNQPGPQPFMFNPCIVYSESPKNIKWGQLGSLIETTSLIYDYRHGPNNRVAFCDSGYVTEKAQGYEIAMYVDEKGRCHPGTPERPLAQIYNFPQEDNSLTSATAIIQKMFQMKKNTAFITMNLQ